MGMPPATEASKASATLWVSASRASSSPCLASKALLAVTTDFPAPSAASTLLRAAPSSPPINSTNRSILSQRASSTGSSNHLTPERSSPRSRTESRAETPVTTMSRPVRAARSRACAVSRRMTAAPTVPRPAMPRRRGSDIFRPLDFDAALAPRPRFASFPRRDQCAPGFGFRLQPFLGLRQGITVGHAGDIVGDQPRPRRLVRA